MRVALRVDASAAIGLGHVQRCLALAQALVEAGGEIVFVTRDLGSNAAERIHRAGFDVRNLPPVERDSVLDSPPPYAQWAMVPWAVDAEQTCQALRDAVPDWLVVDHYAFDARWHSMAAQTMGCRIAVIDDLGDRPLQCELLIDHNPADDHSRKYFGRLPETSTLLGGPRFALIGPGYAQAPRWCPSDSVISIGIFMGGIDARGLSEVAVRGCREIAGFDGPIEVVSTHNSPNLGSLTEAIKRYGAASLLIDLPDLAAFFARHSLQIGAAGGASWERCCIGVPTLAVVAAPNQQIVADALASHGAVAVVSHRESTNVRSVGTAVATLLAAPSTRLRLAERARTLVDGLGATRVALRMLVSTLRLRSATLDDGDLLHRWRNHPHTRGVSRSREEIPIENHRRWMEQVIGNPRRNLFIGMVGRRSVGVIRLDDHEEGQCTEVSLFLDPALYGLGLGGFLLRAGEAACRHEQPSWRLVSSVLDSNLASRRLFTAAGYRFKGDRGEKLLRTNAAVKDTNHENRAT